MFAKNLLFILFALITTNSWCQTEYTGKTRQDSINALMSVIKSMDTYVQPDSNDAGWQYYTFLFLNELSSDEDWIKYSTAQNPCLRIYSYAALVSRNYKGINALHKKLLLDKASLSTNKKLSIATTTVSSVIKTQKIEQLFASKRGKEIMAEFDEDKKLKEYSFRLVVGWRDDHHLKTRKDTINAIKDVMRERKTAESSGVGFMGTPSMQYYRFYFLTTICTTNDWLEMINDSSACVRYYSYQALKCKGYEKLDSIKNALKNDTTRIGYMETCVYGVTSVAGSLEKSAIWIACTADDFFKLVGENSFYQTVFFDALFSNDFKGYNMMR